MNVTWRVSRRRGRRSVARVTGTMRSRSLHWCTDWNKFMASDTRERPASTGGWRVALRLPSKAARTLRMTQAPEAPGRTRAQISERTFRKDPWVREPHATYTGETRFPLIMQNLHRYFFYAVILISILNTYDLVQAFRGPDGSFGLGLGTLIMAVNVVLLWGYTLSCHSCRHITGGRLRNFSSHPVRYWAWTKISWLNARHMQLAWTTLGTLMLTDLYVMLVASGAISDLRIFN